MKTKDIKLEVIEESISRVTREINQIDKQLFDNPIQDLIDLRNEARQALEENKTVEERTSPAFMALVRAWARRETDILKRMKRQSRVDSNKLITRKVELQFQLRDLHSELFFHTHRNR